MIEPVNGNECWKNSSVISPLPSKPPLTVLLCFLTLCLLCRCENVVHEAQLMFGVQSEEKTNAVFALANRLQGVIADCSSQLMKVRLLCQRFSRI